MKKKSSKLVMKWMRKIEKKFNYYVENLKKRENVNDVKKSID
jgi:hypothetical protein